MTTLILIAFAYVFAYNSIENWRNFRGSSRTMRDALLLSGFFAQASSFVCLIASFWLYDWWMPIITFAASILLGGLSAFLFQRGIFGIIASPILAVVFGLLSIGWVVNGLFF